MDKVNYSSEEQQVGSAPAISDEMEEFGESWLRRKAKGISSLVEAYQKVLRAKVILQQATASPSYLVTALNANLTDRESYLFVNWWVSHNFGDAVSPQIVSALSGKTPVPVGRFPILPGRECFSVVGSVISARSPRLTIWGSGYLRVEARFHVSPRKVHAVRGPLTRAVLRRQGVDCPPIYGDPAVFLFDQFAPLVQKADATYEIGLCPHYHDVNNPHVQALASDDRVLLIDVLQPAAVIAREFAKCRRIVSSSLHGLILADSMGVPSRWLGVSEEVLKGGFKFQDYFASVERCENEPLAAENLTVQRVIKEAHLRRRPFDRERLLEACPFRRSSLTQVSDIEFPEAVLVSQMPDGRVDA